MKQPGIRSVSPAIATLTLLLTLSACGGAGGTAPPAGLTISPQEHTLQLDDADNSTVQLRAALDFPGGKQEAAEVNWSTDHPEIVTVDSDGLAKAAGPGKATVSAVFQNQDVQLTDTAIVWVEEPIADVQPEPAGIILNSETVELQLRRNETFELTASIRFTDGTSTAADGMSWESAAEDVATVDSTGFIKAAAAGTTTVTAHSTDYPELEPATVAVDVTAAPKVERLTAEPEFVEMFEHQEEHLDVRIEFSDGSSEPAVLAWTVEDETVLAVTDAGKITGLTPGFTSMTGKSTDHPDLNSVTVDVYVSPTPVDMSTGTQDRYMLPGEETDTHVYYHYPEGDRDYAPPGRLVWKSSNEAVASVDSGTITAHEPGSADITIAEPRQPHLPVLSFTVIVERGEFDPYDLHVNPYRAGTGADQGTRHNPFPTIAAALSEAVTGSTIHISYGTYEEEALVIDTEDITLKGYPTEGHLPQVRAGTPGAHGITVRSSGVTIESLEVSGADLNGITVETPQAGQALSGFTARNVHVSDSGSNGLDLTGLSGATLEHISSRANRGHGLSISASTDVEVHFTESAANSAGGVLIRTADAPAGGSGQHETGSITVSGVQNDAVPVYTRVHSGHTLSSLHLDRQAVAVRHPDAGEPYGTDPSRYVFYFHDHGQALDWAESLEGTVRESLETCDLTGPDATDAADCRDWGLLEP